MKNEKGTPVCSRNYLNYSNYFVSRKRSQLTIFIIIVVLIGAGAAGYFLVKGSLQIPGKPISPETAQIKNFVQECLDDSLENAVFRVGENGGYYFPPKISTPILEVPYYIKNKKNLMPSRGDIEKEISKYAARELVLCFGNFESSSEYEITKGEITAKTTIESENVLIEVNYPLTIIKEDKKSKLENFNSEIPVRLGIVYDAAAEFVGEELAATGTEGTCLSCLLEAAAKNDLYVSSFPYDNKTTIFIITDFNSIINEKEFTYVFANEEY